MGLLNKNNKLTIMFIAMILILGCYYHQSNAQLQVGFYKNSCPQAEFIIRNEVQKSSYFNIGILPALLRLHFHDCFVRGCDASVLIDSTATNSAEKDGLPNANSLRGFEVIDRAKSRIEAICKGVVSCADIVAYAARDAVVLTGGLWWDVPAGRRDGRISIAAETLQMPAPFDNLVRVTQVFAQKGLSQDDMIALSGAHTIGRSHCTSFSNRLYNFSSSNSQDPTLDRHFAAVLKIQCPRINLKENVDPNSLVQMNLSPYLFENSYYRDILGNRGLFTSDQTLTTSPEALQEVRDYAFNDRKWQQDFVEAMIKMSQIEVLTGTAGEIRNNCRVINP